MNAKTDFHPHTFAVIGAGPTGAEMAGALAELARHTLRRDFRNFDPHDARVVLVEAAPRVLRFDEGARRRASGEVRFAGDPCCCSGSLP